MNMASLTISLADEDLDELDALAARLGTTPQALLRAHIEDLLSGRESNFKRVADYVLNKNAELYKRLA